MAAYKILVVDDEVDLVETLKFRLECKGYEVVCAYDGQDGLEKALSERPDLILLDVMLPKHDGYYVCRELRKNTTVARVPIVMLTARSQDADKKTGIDQGADAYVSKPFEPKCLMEKVEELLSRAKKD
ncbi:MAG TPA: response regulator [bacterium]|nr:response regulator [bacterium]